MLRVCQTEIIISIMLGINGVMEIMDEEDWEGIILIQGMPDRNNNKAYVCCCHHGYTYKILTLTTYNLKS